MDKYNKYRALKCRIDYTYHEVHLNRVAASYIWDVANNSGNRHFRLKYLFGFFAALTPNFKQVPRGKIIFSTFGIYRRRDHKELNKCVLDRLDNNKVFSNDIYDWKYRIAFHPFIIVNVLFFIFNSQLAGIKFSDKIAISSKFVQYINSLLQIEKIDFSGIKKYLTQSSVLNYESLLTQFFNSKGVETISLTEAIYTIHHFNRPIDCLQYENFDSDKYLMWGQSSVDAFLEYGISKNRLFVAGYPKDNAQQGMKDHNTFKECMVLLSRALFHESNIKLLEILKEDSLAVKYHLKLHPGDNPSYYDKYVSQYNMSIIPTEMTINETLCKEQFDFAIAVNTNAYYEALMRGVPCMRYCDGSFELPAGYDDIFQTAEEYSTKLSTIRKMCLTDNYQIRINEILEYCIGVGIDNYKTLIEG